MMAEAKTRKPAKPPPRLRFIGAQTMILLTRINGHSRPGVAVLSLRAMVAVWALGAEGGHRRSACGERHGHGQIG